MYRTYSSSTGFVPLIYSSLYDVYTDDLIARKNGLIGLNYVNLLSDNLALDTKLYYTYNATRIEYNRTGADQVYPIGGGYITPFTNPAAYGMITGADLDPNAPMFPSLRIPGEFNETDDYRYGAGVKLDWRASDAHRLLFGIDANIVDTRTTQVAVEYPVTNEFNNIQERNFAAFLQDEWKLTDRLTALMSLRYDWSGINKDEVEETPGVWEPINNKSVDASSPRIALNYRVTDDMALSASWGQSFRAPTLYERFVREGGIFTGRINPDINKETMTAWEAGIYKRFSDKVSIDIAGFINN